MEIDLYIRISKFIDYENHLLDAQQYHEWLTLWKEEGMYIVPIELSNDDYANQLNFAYDDAAMRRMRVARLTSGESISAATSGGTVRLTSRLTVPKATDHLVNAECALMINESRLGSNRLFVANVKYQLEPMDDSFLIHQKIVKLINAEDYLRSISYLL